MLTLVAGYAHLHHTPVDWLWMGLIALVMATPP